MDLIVGKINTAAAQNLFYVNDGTGNFAIKDSPLSSSSKSTRAVTIADLDGDNDADVLVANYAGTPEIWINNGAGELTALEGTPITAASVLAYSILAADLDNDGDNDVILAPINNYWNLGSGALTEVKTTPISADASHTTTVLFADIDGDGDADLFVGNYRQTSGAASRNQLYTNDGYGMAQAQSHGHGHGHGQG